MIRQPLYERLDFLWLLCYIAGGVLLMRLAQIQVVQNVRYARAAEGNRSKIIRQTAPRGRIYDRNGDVVATNQAAFSLIYMPPKEKLDEKYLQNLAKELDPLLREDRGSLFESLQQAVREEAAIRLAENLPPRTMFKLSELKTIYPGVDLIVEARRFYPYAAFASHLLGYMGKMDDRSWRELKGQNYRVDSKIGKTGLEKIFERELRGVDGGIRMEVDAQGRLKRVLERIPWRPGSNIHLTIDAKIQKTAEEALKKSKAGQGAAVVVDPNTGRILALASVPDFDPNRFLQPDSTQTLKDLPEFNLAIQGTFEPGSTFKVIAGAAMLNENKVDPADKTFCPGSFELGNHTFKCWEKKGHFYKDFIGAFTFSCDVYFYKMGLRAGGDVIERYEKLFGLGQKTRIPLPGEKRGNIFGPEARQARKAHWHDGDTVNLSIGQGELLVTPLQMAMVAAAVANRGTMWRPHFIDRIEYADGRPEYKQKPEELRRVELKPQTWDLLQAAMKEAVRSGTGGKAYIQGLEIGGKTGTAQNPGGDDHAWFISYAGRPGEPPSIAFAVLVQEGGHGSDAAVPVARKIIETAFGMGQPAIPAVAVSSTTEVPGAALIQELKPAQPPAMLR